MKLKKISAQNIKGQSFDETLEPITIIAGANDSGKSARADAIRLGLLGYLPEHGKTAGATFALSSEAKMSVTLTGDAGTVKRTWEEKGKSIKTTTTGDEAFNVPLVMLNSAEFFGKGDVARVAMLFDLLTLDKSHTPKGIWEGLSTECNANLDDLFTPDLALEVQPFLEHLADKCKAESAITNETIARYEKTAQGIAELALNTPPIPAARVAKELADARQKIEACAAKIGNITAQIEAAETVQERRGELLNRHSEIRAELGDDPVTSPETRAAKLKELNAELNTLEAEHAAAKRAFERHEGNASKISGLRSKIVAGQEEAKGVKGSGDVEALQKSLDAIPAADPEHCAKVCEARRADVAGIVAQLEALDKTHEDAKAKYNDLIGKQECPICGTVGEHFHDAILNIYTLAAAEVEQSKRRLEGTHTTAQQALREAEGVHNTALKNDKDRTRIQKDISEARVANAELATINERVESARRELETLADYSVEKPTEPKRLVELRGLIGELEREDSRAGLAKSLQDLDRQLEEMENPDVNALEQSKTAVEQDKTNLEARVRVLEEDEKTANKQAADAKTLQEAADAKTKEIARGELLKALKKKVAEKRETLINDALQPLLKKMQRFTDGILPTPLEFRDGELGRWKGSRWIPSHVFGGTHNAVTVAGLQAALAVNSPAKLVIVDELGRFDESNKQLFLENVSKAIKAGDLEQFIGIDVEAKPYEKIKKAGIALQLIKV